MPASPSTTAVDRPVRSTLMFGRGLMVPFLSRVA